MVHLEYLVRTTSINYLVWKTLRETVVHAYSVPSQLPRYTTLLRRVVFIFASTMSFELARANPDGLPSVNHN